MFGIEQADFNVIAEDWPVSYGENQQKAFLACFGSLRELLYGASALPREQINAQIGLSYVEASVLCNKIYQEYETFQL